jgi:hypothetical protein
MEICIVPVREIVRAGFDGTGGDELGHGLPCLAGFNLGLSLGFACVFQECDDHRLPVAAAAAAKWSDADPHGFTRVEIK